MTESLKELLDELIDLVADDGFVIVENHKDNARLEQLKSEILAFENKQDEIELLQKNLAHYKFLEDNYRKFSLADTKKIEELEAKLNSQDTNAKIVQRLRKRLENRQGCDSYPVNDAIISELKSILESKE